MSLSNNFPAIKPSLLLDFANTKALDPRVTFTRSTTATYYDGVTTAKAEENLFTRSQEFEGGDWSKTGTTITANAATAPDGTSTADQMIETTDTSNHRVQQGINATNGLTYTFSVFAKKGVLASARNFIQLAVPTTPFGANAYANFDILNGTIPTQGAGLVSAAITNVGSGWYRCSIVATATSTIAANFWLQIAQSGTDAILPSYAGSTSADVLLWGAQAEQRSSVTAYTATTTQPITNYIPVLMTAAAGVPRFDHNPTTDESLGLLIEEARTNLAIYSEDLSNAAWSFGNATLSSNTTISPGGTQTADQLVTSAATAATFARENVTLSAGSATLSVYLKSGGVQFAQFLWASVFNGTDYANFDLVNGTVTAGTYTAATITSVGNGWYRCTITSTVTASVGNFIYIAAVPASNSGRLTSYTGNGWNSLYIWGVQLEQAAFATSYIPTVASTVTRNADTASMTGTNFSSWYNFAEGAFYYEASKYRSGNNYSNLLIVRNTATSLQERNPDVALGTGTSGNAGVFRVDYRTNNVVQANLGDITSFSANTFYKGATAYRVNDFASAVNGGSLTTAASGQVSSTVNTLEIGSRLSSDFLNGTIKKIAYYPLRVTNAQLQALTS